MSFHDKYLWMPRDPDCLSDGKKGLGTSCDDRQKHQALWDAPEPEIFCSRKKQAVESIHHRPIPHSACPNNVLWNNGSKSQSTSTQLGNLFFGPESFRPLEFLDKSISSGEDKSQNVEKIGSVQQFGNEPAVNLSTSHNMEVPLGLNTGVETQAVESIDHRPIPHSDCPNNVLWDNGSKSQSTSTQFANLFFGPESFRPLEFADKSISSSEDKSLNVEKTGSVQKSGNEPAVNLSMSHNMEVPLGLNTGVEIQAVESIDHRPIPHSDCPNNVLWDNGSKSQSTSTQFANLFFGPESFRPLEFADKSISSGEDKSLNVEKTGSVQQSGNEPAVNLSMSHNMEVPLGLNTGVETQAVESIDHRPIPHSDCPNNVLWDNGSKSQSTSTLFGNLFFGPESFRPLEFADKSISSGEDKSQNVEKTGSVQQFGNEPAVNLSTSHNREVPLGVNTGVGIANLSMVGNSANSFSISMGNGLSYIAAENSQLALATSFQGGHSNGLFQRAYQKEDEYSVPHSQSSSLSYVNLISNGQALTKSPNEFVRLDQLSGAHVSPALNDVFETQPNYSFSSSIPCSREHDNMVMVAPRFGNTVSSFNSTNLSFDTRDAVTTTPSNYEEDVPPTSLGGISYNAGSSSMLSMNQRYDDAEGTIISFGLEAKDSSSGVISGSDTLLSQSLTQDTEPLTQVYPEPIINQVLNVTTTSKTSGVSKKTESKKVQSNNFPSNVKSLLSTGILDGVPVKYVSWSKERNLRGIIKGSGYLCDCSDCHLSKTVNAYEFERHAGCKTKHPNNHIYFDNGKTIYSVVQELKSTPQELLFEVIQNVTGSPINQKNFRTWKVSYQAATRELARIYGKDDSPVPS